MHEKITGIILAGGKSIRMGKNKALVKYKQKRLIDWAINIINPLVDYLIISSNEPIPKVPYLMVKDEIENIGPIGGLYSALKKSQTKVNIIIACDTPKIPSELYEKLILKSKGYDAVIPVHEDGTYEPMVALYSKKILKIIEKQIANKDYKMQNLIAKLKICKYKLTHSKPFMNMNTPTDLTSSESTVF